ncbi:collectin-12-like [Mizuhopecten yessoensis]|uniref:collectin-12-like n=1 Tax=Mizuhopecten yessoensis TaxID=6573 RepID=UPI000B4581B5|nr:collectin-12-like [Mizuhopecten yessoensis]
MATCTGDYNGHLLVIDSLSKLRRIQQYLIMISMMDGYHVTVIDGTDDVKEGDWRYHDNRSLTFSEWGGLEPVTGYADNEDCLALDPGYDFKMNDVLCDDPHPFICENTLY